ncbi:hypothetical protein C8R45DRAFT_1221251 [Mycena sanguinolenta]|nr:hypothetical protein C8R45DRAFT_1221251 [Mycena sanguinolenta]
MASSAINYIVSFLTRPLMKTYSPATILALQLSLHASLSSAPKSSSLVLSTKVPPPLALQRACVVAGIRWAEWIRLLSRGLDVHILVTDSTVAVALGRMPPRIVWVAPPAGKHAPASFHAPAFLSIAPRRSAHLRATFTSARARSCRGAALNPTRIPTLLSASYNADDLASDSESDSDLDSDSDVSESGSVSSSATSVSSTSSRSRSRAALCPTPDDVERYIYDNGVTQVVSGRVMLGPPVFSKGKGRPSGRPANSTRKVAASLAANWRKST